MRVKVSRRIKNYCSKHVNALSSHNQWTLILMFLILRAEKLCITYHLFSVTFSLFSLLTIVSDQPCCQCQIQQEEVISRYVFSRVQNCLTGELEDGQQRLSTMLVQITVISLSGTKFQPENVSYFWAKKSYRPKYQKLFL